jgi:hypothetical protein
MIYILLKFDEPVFYLAVSKFAIQKILLNLGKIFAICFADSSRPKPLTKLAIPQPALSITATLENQTMVVH